MDGFTFPALNAARLLSMIVLLISAKLRAMLHQILESSELIYGYKFLISHE
jgi:hypothetical protein